MRAMIVLALALGTLGSSGTQRAPRSAGPRTSLGKELDTSHEAVVAISADLPNRGPATGTLIGTAVVLTAGHVSPSPATDLPPRIVAFGANANEAAQRIRLNSATGSRPHPSFLSFVETFGRSPGERPDFLDVGLMVLPQPVAGVTPAALPEPGVLDRIASTDRFLGVGYGYSEIVRESDAGTSSPPDGKRRRWWTGVKVLNEAWIRLEDDPAKGYGQLCRGDSGAPIFMQRRGREVLAGVVSHSDGQGCGPGIATYAVRVDNPAVLNWIRNEIKQPEKSSAR
jgi:Trypsin